MAKYKINREVRKYVSDKEDIESICAQILFYNQGDDPVTVKVRAYDIDGFIVHPGKYIVFGELNPETLETDLFQVFFAGEGATPAILVMRVNIFENV